MNTRKVSGEWLLEQFPQIHGVLMAMAHQGFVAGGAARQVVIKEFSPNTEVPPPGDIDVFKYHKGEWFMDKLILSGYRKGRTTVFTTEWHKRATSGPLVADEGLKVQIVEPHANENLRMWGSAGEVLSNFDFTINMYAVSLDYTATTLGERFILTSGDESFGHLLRKELVLQHMNSPIGMAARIAKYHKMGFSFSLLLLARCFMAFNENKELAQKTIDGIKKYDTGEAVDMSDLYRLMRD